MSERFRERRLQLLISAGCVIPALLVVLQGYVSAKLNGHARDWKDTVFSGADWLALGFLTFIPYQFAQRFALRGRAWKSSLGLHLFGALTFSVAWASIGMVLGFVLHRFPWVNPVALAYLNWILIAIPFGTLIYFAMLGCVYAYQYFVLAHERETEASRLAAQLAEVRLGALRMQLNPHFLFNSLNTVLVLVREKDTAAASRMLELLADVLRQVLEAERPHEVPLSYELRFIERYLAIEQVRFSDRLRVEWSIDDRVRSALVPDLVMQPLVENAVRHGVTTRAEGGTISISARIVDGSLELAVQDDGAGMLRGESGREGVGLSNTRERLRALYGDAASVTIVSPPGGGTKVLLKIPMQR